MESAPDDPDSLQSQMDLLRSSLRTEVHDLVHNAKTMTDWHYYWRGHPALCCGAAAVLGYLLVPARKGDLVSGVDRLTRAHEQMLKSMPQARKKSLARELAGIALGLALKGGLSFVGQQVERYFSSGPLPASTGPANPQSMSPANAEATPHEKSH